jgi:hypothetical protein
MGTASALIPPAAYAPEGWLAKLASGQDPITMWAAPSYSRFAL